MGNYSFEEFLDTFGGVPDRDDPQYAGPDPREVIDTRRAELRDGFAVNVSATDVTEDAAANTALTGCPDGTSAHLLTKAPAGYGKTTYTFELSL